MDDASVLKRKISKADLNSLLDHVLSKLEYQSLKHLTPSFAARCVGTAHVCKRRDRNWATFSTGFYHLFSRPIANSSMVHLSVTEQPVRLLGIIGSRLKGEGTFAEEMLQSGNVEVVPSKS